MRYSQVLNCSLPSWYKKFKKVTIPTKFIPLPQDFIVYLHQDGVVLPEGADSGNGDEKDCDSSSNLKVVKWDDWDCPTSQAPFFPDLDKAIREAIGDLGGSVFPKLNWSSPKDAAWITANHSLQCWTPDDIYLLLKSSDFTTHDLTSPFKDCDGDEAAEDISYQLVLRKWIEINPGMEFRCFVKNDHIIGMCQRDTTNFYSFIVHQEADIIQDIVSFYNESVKGKFPDEDYVLDVYRICKDNVKLVDFNVFGKTTDALLFDWDEFSNDALQPASHSSKPEFRCISTPTGIQPNPYRWYAMPTDFLHLATGHDPLKLMDFLKMKIQTDDAVSSDDEDHS